MQIYALFSVLFTGLDNVAVYQNGQIRGMFETFSRYLSVVPLGADHIFRLGKVRIIKNRVHLYYVFNCICVRHCISVFKFKPHSSTEKKLELKRTGRALALGCDVFYLYLYLTVFAYVTVFQYSYSNHALQLGKSWN